MVVLLGLWLLTSAFGYIYICVYERINVFQNCRRVMLALRLLKVMRCEALATDLCVCKCVLKLWFRCPFQHL